MAAQPPPPPRRARRRNVLPCGVFAALVGLLFVGGAAASLYLVFAEYSGVRNLWLVACGAPVALVLGLAGLAFTLYSRYGRPLRQILRAIDAVAEGDLAVRVPGDDSPQFGELIKRFNSMVGQLERADQERRRLTADIAHELRTPLHVIQGNLEGVLDGVYAPTPEHLSATLEETRLLTRLVDDLQTLALAESGHLPLHPARFRLAELLQDLATSFTAQAAAGGLTLTTGLANPDQQLVADYDRLNQVLSNLIANAVRHTPPGGRIAIEAGAGPDAERPVSIQVADTGSGIAPEALPHIFDRFWRADRSRSDRTHSGLGLAIAQQLVHAHGGRLRVRSEVGRGSTFVVELPETAPPSDPAV